MCLNLFSKNLLRILGITDRCIMKRTFVNTGKCIWCGRSVPEVTFYSEPHILPHSLGGDEIGVDVSDDCNHYFGKATRGIPIVNLRYLVRS